MRINWQDPQSFGFTTMEVTGWKDGPRLSRETIPTPGRAGVTLAPVATGGARTLTALFLARPASLAQRDALLRTWADITSGMQWLSFDDAPDAAVRAIRTEWQVTAPSSAIYANNETYVQCTWVAVDGIRVERRARVEAVPTAGSITLPIGTAPSMPVLHWTGAWSSGTARTVTLTNGAGLSLGTLTLTAPTSPADSLTANDAIEVDMGARTITKITGAGVRTNAFAWKTAGAFFGLEATDAIRDAQSWPRLTLSAGEGVVTYVRGDAL